MPWGDPSDYWFNRVPANSSPLPAMRFGAELRQQQVDNQRQALRDAILQRNSELNATKSLFEMQEYFDKRALQNKILQGNAALAGTLKSITDWTSPDAIGRIADLGVEHPELVGTPQYKGAIELYQNALKAKELKDRINDSGYVPPDEETGAPGYYKDARGGIRFAPVDKAAAPAAKWVPPDGDMPGHFEVGGGRVQFPPRAMDDGTTFTPTEMTLPSGTKLYHASPNVWRESTKPPKPGQMTDIEKKKSQDIISRRNALMKDLAVPSTIMGEKLYKEAKANYDKRMAEVDVLSKQLNDLYATIEGRADKAEEKKPETKVEDKNPLGLDLNLKQ